MPDPHPKRASGVDCVPGSAPRSWSHQEAVHEFEQDLEVVQGPYVITRELWGA